MLEGQCVREGVIIDLSSGAIEAFQVS